MTVLYAWIQAHQLIVGIITPIILGGLSLILVPAKVIKWGFLTSQWIRHLFGARAEKEFEQAIDEFDQGLHSDDKQ